MNTTTEELSDNELDSVSGGYNIIVGIGKAILGAIEAAGNAIANAVPASTGSGSGSGTGVAPRSTWL
jgi:lactobin A/cerein 7B family class IIb bacteriocin